MKGAKYPISWREFPQLECDMCTPRITGHWHKDSWFLQLSPAHVRRGQGWRHGQSGGHSERTALPWQGRCCSPSLSNHSGNANIMIQGVPARRGGCCWSALCLLQWGNGRGDEFGRGGREGQRCSLHSYHLVLQECIGLQQVKWTLLKMAGLEPPGWYVAPLHLPPLPYHQKAAWQSGTVAARGWRKVQLVAGDGGGVQMIHWSRTSYPIHLLGILDLEVPWNPTKTPQSALPHWGHWQWVSASLRKKLVKIQAPNTIFSSDLIYAEK